MKDSELNEKIAEIYFGWKWVSYVGVPIRGTPNYPQKTRVRMFLSPKQQASEAMANWVKEYDARDADGTEPLAYDYCSSHSYAVPPPHFTGDWNAIRELEETIRKDDGDWSVYQWHLEKSVLKSNMPWFDATKRQRCRAALRTKGVQLHETQEQITDEE